MVPTRQRGFSLIELLLALAIAGVLLGIAAVSISPQRSAVNQASTGLANYIARARFEALKENTNAGIAFSTAGDGSYELCLDENRDGACDSGKILETVTFGAGDNARVRLTNATNATIMFDRRGVSLDPGTVVTLTSRSGSYSRNVTVLASGKAEVQ